jgi:hypothetical protein
MVIVYLFASFLGTLTTFVVLSSYGWLIALLCAPLAGSCVVGIVAVMYALVYAVRAHEAFLESAEENDFIDTHEQERPAA